MEACRNPCHLYEPFIVNSMAKNAFSLWSDTQSRPPVGSVSGQQSLNPGPIYKQADGMHTAT